MKGQQEGRKEKGKRIREKGKRELGGGMKKKKKRMGGKKERRKRT